MQNLKKILFIPDVHSPYHDKKAWKLVMNVASDFKPEITVLMGDFWDCFAISTYSKDPTRALQLEEEIKEPKRMLDQLDALGSTRKIFIEGNHEDRLRRYLQDKAPELFSSIDTKKIFGLEKRGWEHVPYKAHTKLGKLYLTHDVGSAGKYSTYRALEAFQHSVVIGHSHRMCYIVEGNATGESMVAAQFGWLGDVNQIDYLHLINAKKNWMLGFGIGYLKISGKQKDCVHISPIAIVTTNNCYSCVVEGVLYEQ